MASPQDRTGRVRVRGSARRWAPADHADITFTITRTGATSTKAVADASAAYAQLDQALMRAGEVVTRRTTVALTVREITRYDPETGREHRDGFTASRSETVRFAPVDRAGDVLRPLALAVPDLAVVGPQYGLAPDHPVYAAVRAAAAADARTAASAYAAGLGLSLGAVQRLTEPGLSGGGSPYGDLRSGPMAMMAKADLAGGSDGEPAVLVDLTPEDVEVTATIDLDIALATPTSTPETETQTEIQAEMA